MSSPRGSFQCNAPGCRVVCRTGQRLAAHKAASHPTPAAPRQRARTAPPAVQAAPAIPPAPVRDVAHTLLLPNEDVCRWTITRPAAEAGLEVDRLVSVRITHDTMADGARAAIFATATERDRFALIEAKVKCDLSGTGVKTLRVDEAHRAGATVHVSSNTAAEDSVRISARWAMKPAAAPAAGNV